MDFLRKMENLLKSLLQCQNWIIIPFIGLHIRAKDFVCLIDDSPLLTPCESDENGSHHRAWQQ
jgi:hypothetical protein